MKQNNQTTEQAYARIEVKRARRWWCLGLVFASWIVGMFFLKHAGAVVDGINHGSSYEEGMSQIRQGILHAGIGFCFLFLVPNIWIGRLPSREEMTLLKHHTLNNPLDRTS